MSLTHRQKILIGIIAQLILVITVYVIITIYYNDHFSNNAKLYFRYGIAIDIVLSSILYDKLVKGDEKRLLNSYASFIFWQFIAVVAAIIIFFNIYSPSMVVVKIFSIFLMLEIFLVYVYFKYYYRRPKPSSPEQIDISNQIDELQTDSSQGLKSFYLIVFILLFVPVLLTFAIIYFANFL